MGDSGVRGPEAGPPMLQRTRMPRRLWTRRVKGAPNHMFLMENSKYFNTDSQN